MSRFAYTWKSSDGIRHADEIVAKTRDAAFEELRKVGIRPIKVSEIIAPWRQWFRVICIAGLVALSALAIMASVRRGADDSTIVSDADVRVLDSFEAQARSIKEQYHQSVCVIRQGDVERLNKKRLALEVSRSRLRLAYKEITSSLSNSQKARENAALIYGNAVSYYDNIEFDIEADE